MLLLDFLNMKKKIDIKWLVQRNKGDFDKCNFNMLINEILNTQESK